MRKKEIVVEEVPISEVRKCSRIAHFQKKNKKKKQPLFISYRKR